MAKFQVAPSRLARYYFLECDRFLRYDAATKSTRKDQGIPARDHSVSPVNRAILATGEAWEEHVLTSYLAGDYVAGEATDTDAPITSRQLTVEQTLRELRTLEPGKALFQPTLRAPDSLYEAYGLDQDLVTFGDTRPDLLMAVQTDDGLELRVVDLKASDYMKLSHRIQVGIYTIILNHLLENEGLADRFQPTREGGVWLYQQPEPEWFPLSSIVPPIETFLRHELTPLLESPPEDAFWHLYYRCEWCDFFSHCRDEAHATDDVSLVPYLSHFAKRHLADSEVGTVTEFAELLDRDDVEESLAGSASLEGRAQHFRRTVESLRSGEPRPTGSASVAMPKGEGCRIVLTIQEDPLTGEAFGYAINRLFGGDVFDEATATVARVAPSGSPDDLGALRRSLVADLLAILEPIHAHNAATDDWWSQASVQVYVFDTYERELLVEALIRVIEEADTVAAVEDALKLLFHFQHPDLAGLDDQPAKEVFFPVVVLTQVLRQTLALPIPVTYRFADVNAALRPSKYPFEYRHSDYYDFELSNRMRSDALMRLWSGDQPEGRDLAEEIARQLRFRVWGTNSIINGLREQLDDEVLFAYPPKFRFPDSFGFDDPTLSRIAFIAQYESVLGYLDKRGRRTAPEAERLAEGDTLEATALGNGEYQLHERHADHELKLGFWDYLVTRDTEAGRKARLAFDDFRYRVAMWAPKKMELALGQINSRTEDGLLRAQLKPSQEWVEPAAGERCLFERRYTDWNTRHVITQLGQLDQQADSRFVRLLRDPVDARRALPLPPEVGSVARALANEHGMTPSQRRALGGLVGHDTQLVWGPPGTGKTHFLALAVLALAEAHRRAGRPFTVLVTAFTHAAIDNCLRKICELQEELGLFGAELPIRKLNANEHSPVAALDPREAPTFARRNPVNVIGSTVWQLRKVGRDDLAFDLVVIDEGSQVMVGEASIPIWRLAEDGRLLIAGDDKQLPPIVQGGYPEADDQPLLHRSILECIRAAAGDGDDELTVALVENWRMCDVLCAYPASSIYPAEYAPATSEVSARRLPEGPGAGADELTRLVLDPDFPAVLCVLEDVKATAENQVEAGLVADVVCALRELSDDLDDEAFWSERLFVVSPHHVQIRAIERALAERREWDARPFVDTVDKMQGQECDAVVVSYGVADVEYALGEREFIYSLNRLNVAYTRARAKSIVFIPRPLLEPPIQALESDRTAEGIAFMQGLANWIETNGETISLDLPDVGRVTVLRA